MPSASNGNRRTKPGPDASGRIVLGSGNTFADLGRSNPDLALAKAELVQRIRALIAERKFTQANASKVLGFDQPKVSALLRGRVEAYSLERLFRLLTALGRRIEITMRPQASTTASRAVEGR